MSLPDYYAILGVAFGVSRDGLARAYRLKARECHPDLHPVGRKDWADAQMKLLNEAYRTLGDEASRAEYDRRYRRTFVERSHTGVYHSSTKPGARKYNSRIAARTIIAYSLDAVALLYLAIGAYLFFVVWQPLFEEYGSMFTHPYHWLFFVMWFVLLGRMLFRVIPFRRLR